MGSVDWILFYFSGVHGGRGVYQITLTFFEAVEYIDLYIFVAWKNEPVECFVCNQFQIRPLAIFGHRSSLEICRWDRQNVYGLFL